MNAQNVDAATGIRFGVMPVNRLGDSGLDNIELWGVDPELEKVILREVRYLVYCLEHNLTPVMLIHLDQEDAEEMLEIARAREIDLEPEHKRRVELMRRVFADWGPQLIGYEPDYQTYDHDGISLVIYADSPYVVVTESPWVAQCRLCSPVFPNAGNLDEPDEEYGFATYALDNSWFDEQAPYTYWTPEELLHQKGAAT